MLLMAGHKQAISRISKDSQNIFIYDFIITTFNCQGSRQGGDISPSAFALAHPGVAPPLCTDPVENKSCKELVKGAGQIPWRKAELIYLIAVDLIYSL